MDMRVIPGSEMLRRLNYRGNDIVTKDNTFTMIESFGQLIFYKGELNLENSVCVILKNNDFTEGRGPMVVHKIYKNYDKAVSYILTQSGIMGSKQSSTNYVGVNISGSPYCVSGFNGYEIKIMTVE